MIRFLSPTILFPDIMAKILFTCAMLVTSSLAKHVDVSKTHSSIQGFKKIGNVRGLEQTNTFVFIDLETLKDKFGDEADLSNIVIEGTNFRPLADHEVQNVDFKSVEESLNGGGESSASEEDGVHHSIKLMHQTQAASAKKVPAGAVLTKFFGAGSQSSVLGPVRQVTAGVRQVPDAATKHPHQAPVAPAPSFSAPRARIVQHQHHQAGAGAGAGDKDDSLAVLESLKLLKGRRIRKFE